MHTRWIVPLVVASFVLPALADEPATGPATGPATPTTFPTPGDVIKQMKQRVADEAAKPKVAYFNLADPVTERPVEFSLFAGRKGYALHELLAAVHKAKDDVTVKAVLVTLGQHRMSFAQAQELRDALASLKGADKRVFVYADEYDTVGYTVATGASDVCLLGGGMIAIPGVGLQATFAKGLLDKVGVKADYVQIGEYKGAQEPFTRTAPTDELRGELTKLVDALYAQIVDGIATHRNVPAEKVRALIDASLVGAKDAKARGFVDHLVDPDSLRALLKEAIGQEPNLIADYGKPKEETPDFSNPFALLSMFSKKAEVSDRPAIALIHAEGTIVDGRSEESLFGGSSSVGSENIREALRVAARDERVKGVVLRIDSPGGSALASEAMWQAARRLAAKKPLVISIGGMAASGGYYLASAGDTIYADPTAIVGSIGVVGGKFVTKDLFDKIGITSEPFQKGLNADLFSSDHPFTDDQRTLVTGWMKETYQQFVDRIMETRRAKITDIDAVARGRIFLATQAKELGMVDELGGVEAALENVAGRTELKAGEYDVRVIPGPKTLADLFGGDSADGSDARLPFREAVVSPEAMLLQALPADARDAVVQQLTLLSMLQRRPFILASPVTIRLK